MNLRTFTRKRSACGGPCIDLPPRALRFEPFQRLSLYVAPACKPARSKVARPFCQPILCPRRTTLSRFQEPPAANLRSDSQSVSAETNPETRRTSACCSAACDTQACEAQMCFSAMSGFAWNRRLGARHAAITAAPCHLCLIYTPRPAHWSCAMASATSSSVRVHGPPRIFSSAASYSLGYLFFLAVAPYDVLVPERFASWLRLQHPSTAPAQLPFWRWPTIAYRCALSLSLSRRPPSSTLLPASFAVPSFRLPMDPSPDEFGGSRACGPRPADLTTRTAMVA
jgi:hypothetical protein